MSFTLREKVSLNAEIKELKIRSLYLRQRLKEAETMKGKQIKDADFIIRSFLSGSYDAYAIEMYCKEYAKKHWGSSNAK